MNKPKLYIKKENNRYETYIEPEHPKYDNAFYRRCGKIKTTKGDPPIRRIVKGAGHSNKIDPVHGLLDALYCFDLGEGKVSE